MSEPLIPTPPRKKSLPIERREPKRANAKDELLQGRRRRCDPDPPQTVEVDPI